ncbi:MAG: YcjF family protein [Paracoccaceae bacterium]
MAKGPVLIELDAEKPAPKVSEAPPVPDFDAPTGQAVQKAAQIATYRPSRLVRWVWGLAVALIGAVISLNAWAFVWDLIARSPAVGYAFTALLVAFLLAGSVLILRELAALSRLSRIDHVRHSAAEARAGSDLRAARSVTDQVNTLYKRRADTRWGRERVTELRGDQLDAQALLDLTEREILGPLDSAAQAQIETAARHVATVTALVPMAFADVFAALTSNIRMIRRIAEIYGGRSGFWGSWRLTRAVLSHLVATGAVAVGDDLLEPLLGGSILGKLSRRFGEGLVNGALTARVGIAAMEVCRPLPFAARTAPRSRDIIRRALTGLIPGNS